MRVVLVFYNHGDSWVSNWLLHEDYKHVDCFIEVGKRWFVLRLTHSGIAVRRSRYFSAGSLFNAAKKLSTVTCIIEIESYYVLRETFFVPRILTCNELARYLSKVDVGLTLTPYHFYKKLLKYDHMRNYEIITHWRR